MDQAPDESAVPKAQGANPRFLIVTSIVALWVTMRLVFWVGYVGSDDFFYADFAYHGDRKPTIHYECRWPQIWAMRAGYRILGPTELAACLPALTGSAMIFAATAWIVGWPRRLDPEATYAMLFVSVMPLDVMLASYPVASILTCGFLALGTAAMLKGGARIAMAGSALLAVGVFNHVLMFYYVAILCVTLLLYDWRRFLLPIVLAAVLTMALFGTQCVYHWQQYDSPLLRFQLSAYYASGEVDLNLRAQGSPIAFYLLPLAMVLDYRLFAFLLPFVFAMGFFFWPRLDSNQRILLLVATGFFLWIGYGTVVPWRYKPITRGMHYYLPLVMPAAVLASAILWRTKFAARRIWFAHVAGWLFVGLAVVGSADRSIWGQWVDVSRHFLAYVQQHPQDRFVTDADTLNALYVLNGFTVPPNVVCLKGPKADEDLLPPQGHGQSVTVQPDRSQPAIALLNMVQIATAEDPAFRSYVSDRPWEIMDVTPPQYRWSMVPLVRAGLFGPQEPGVLAGFGPQGRWLRSYGGAVAQMPPVEAQDESPSDSASVEPGVGANREYHSQ